MKTSASDPHELNDNGFTLRLVLHYELGHDKLEPMALQILWPYY